MNTILCIWDSALIAEAARRANCESKSTIISAKDRFGTMNGHPAKSFHFVRSGFGSEKVRIASCAAWTLERKWAHNRDFVREHA
jgi:hypothetical protein